MDMTTHPSIIHEENRSSSGVNNNSSSRRDERNPLLPLTNAHTHSEESSVLKGNGKKFALAGAFAIVATLGVIYQSSAPSSSSMSPGLHDPASTHLEVTVLSSVSFETAAEAQKSESLPDGMIENLVDLEVSCNNGLQALVGFQMVGPATTDEDDLKYQFYCDDSGSPIYSKVAITTEPVPDIYGHSVSNLRYFNVDCSKKGINYVLSSFKMVEIEPNDDAEGPDLSYEYSCLTYDEAMLTCSQFYTDLMDPGYTIGNDEEGEVGTLEAQSVQCFNGGALQSFEYQVVEQQIRYAYQCCMKSALPTTSPTQEPNPKPSQYPTVEPNAKPTQEPHFKPTQEPSLEPTVEPTAHPVAKSSKEPTLEPIAHPTMRPSMEPTFEPTKEPSPDNTQFPTYYPTEYPSESPLAKPTREPSIQSPHSKPTEEPTNEPVSEPTEKPNGKPTMEPTVDPETTPEAIAQYNLPKFCPFTYLAGTTELDIPGGCAFFSQDDIQYMRDEETSNSIIICNGEELGSLNMDLEEFERFGLYDSVTKESLISVIVPGADTVVPFYEGRYEGLVDVYTESHHPPLPLTKKNDMIKTAVLSTSIKARNVRIPDVCDILDAEESVEEASEHDDDDGVAVDITDVNLMARKHAKIMEQKYSALSLNKENLSDKEIDAEKKRLAEMESKMDENEKTKQLEQEEEGEKEAAEKLANDTEEPSKVEDRREEKDYSKYELLKPDEETEEEHKAKEEALAAAVHAKEASSEHAEKQAKWDKEQEEHEKEVEDQKDEDMEDEEEDVHEKKSAAEIAHDKKQALWDKEHSEGEDKAAASKLEVAKSIHDESIPCKIGCVAKDTEDQVHEGESVAHKEKQAEWDQAQKLKELDTASKSDGKDGLTDEQRLVESVEADQERKDEALEKTVEQDMKIIAEKDEEEVDEKEEKDEKKKED